LNASTNLAAIDLYPQAGQLTGTITPDTLFQNFTDYDKDFNGDLYDWTYRGAYSGCCVNNGWQLQLDTMAIPAGTITYINRPEDSNGIIFYPNPVYLQLNYSISTDKPVELTIFDLEGRIIKKHNTEFHLGRVDVSELPAGVYILRINHNYKTSEFRIIKM
jgi:hypothetical protein